MISWTRNPLIAVLLHSDWQRRSLCSTNRQSRDSRFNAGPRTVERTTSTATQRPMTAPHNVAIRPVLKNSARMHTYTHISWLFFFCVQRWQATRDYVRFFQPFLGYISDNFCPSPNPPQSTARHYPLEILNAVLDKVIFCHNGSQMSLRHNQPPMDTSQSRIKSFHNFATYFSKVIYLSSLHNTKAFGEVEMLLHAILT
jgi:hypothetical protein